MIELRDQAREFRFPEVHEEARCRIDVQRTLRIPDDNRSYPLPPGLGRFPLAHVDDFADRLPPSWRTHGGVFLPMYQAEAMWLHFGGGYPCAIKIAAGKINAVTGKMKRAVYHQLFETQVRVSDGLAECMVCCDLASPMGLAPGGLMRQEIYEDGYGIDAWDQDHGSRCFVHIVNSAQYQQITGRPPPHAPPSAKDYSAAGLPWFEYYDDRKAVEGSPDLQKLLSVGANWLSKKKGEMPDNEAAVPKVVRTLGVGAVREGEF
jgi:hypothetical protein